MSGRDSPRERSRRLRWEAALRDPTAICKEGGRHASFEKEPLRTEYFCHGHCIDVGRFNSISSNLTIAEIAVRIYFNQFSFLSLNAKE
jgi:hypothetical protein